MFVTSPTNSSDTSRTFLTRSAGAPEAVTAVSATTAAATNARLSTGPAGPPTPRRGGHEITVLRRVDLNPDGICTGASWLNLPPPNEQTLTTSDGGAAALHFEISRGAPLLDGVSFDVQWRLVGTDGSILQSDCLTVTVK